MEMQEADGRCVRIVTECGEAFDGDCSFCPGEYCMAEIGREEDALEIDNWMFFESEIRSVTEIEAPSVWKSRPLHRMRLVPDAMERIESGEKRFELRLNDEKRRLLRIGDAIRFESTEDDSDVLYVTVEALYRFASFDALYAALPLREIGYSEQEAPTASPRDMDAYYSSEQQAKYGVLAIRVRPVE